MQRLTREHLTMSVMVDMYCRDHHSPADDLCGDCAEFLDYAKVRLDKCPYGEDKPTCANCPVHCYKPHYKARAKQIMRYAGPRMLLRHPIMTIAHYLDGRRRTRHPRELTREERLGRRIP
jgi:hypothetical protein